MFETEKERQGNTYSISFLAKIEAIKHLFFFLFVWFNVPSMLDQSYNLGTLLYSDRKGLDCLTGFSLSNFSGDCVF